jgi:uncharacterized protein
MIMIIDSHIHPPFLKSEVFDEASKASGTDFSPEGLAQDMKRYGVQKALAYAIYLPGTTLTNEQLLAATAGRNDLLPVASVDPQKIDLQKLERWFKQNAFTAIKLYPGYWNISPTDRRFEPIYDLCEKQNVPLIVHMGDPLVKSASLRYCHPMYVDDLAVAWPNLKIIICHYGNPWLTETTEILYKNDNVSADLSGFFLGSTKYTQKATCALIRNLSERIWDLGTVENKILFGSDWPITPIGRTIDLVNKLEIDDADKERIFWKNAVNIFTLKT